MTSPIEKSIRRALEAGAPESLEFRQGVYRAAERAIERVLEKESDSAQIEAKRLELREAIARVEADYAGPDDDGELANTDEASELDVIDPDPVSADETGGAGLNEAAPIVHPDDEPEDFPDDAVTPVSPDTFRAADTAPTVPSQSFETPSAGDPHSDPSPRSPSRQPRAFAPPSQSEGEEPFTDELDPADITPSREPAASEATPGGAGRLGAISRREDGIAVGTRDGNVDKRPDFDTWRPGSGHPKVKRRSKAGGLLVSALIICLFAFLLIAGAYLLAPFLISAASNEAPRSAAEGETTPETTSETQNWITVFSGREIGQITTPDGGRVTTEQAPDGSSAVRISGPVDGGGGEIGFNVGPGVVAKLAGRDVRAELTVGSTGGEERSFAVRCIFENETRCGRQRFTTSLMRESFIFAIDLSGVGDGGGDISIDPAIGDGNDLLVYELRLTANGGN